MARQPFPKLRALKERFADATRELTAAGYEHVSTVMTDGNVGTDYGQAFMHPKAPTFYLNVETFGSRERRGQAGDTRTRALARRVSRRGASLLPLTR